MVVSQVVRLYQADPLAWLICDYAGRCGALLILAAIPAARAVASERRSLRIAWWEVALWIVSLVVFDRLIGTWLRRFAAATFFDGRLGQYPVLHGWIHAFDITLGLALVAFSEEMMFRRCARHVLHRTLGDGYAMVIVTSTIFAAYHWWSGVGNIAAAALLGCLAMLFYLRASALWPVVLAHYLVDVFGFA
jgi:membrane protease YdiL (CAAX protease family)